MTPDWLLTPQKYWGSQAYAFVWVTWIYYEKKKSYCILNENQNLTTMTPNDPRLTFNPITQVEGLKLMNMYESYGHAM